ncbi:Uncharacterized protein APZ42_018281 [Daphnia magna]|uniref:Uncharacterized protein n=1 Tax=Daphnia magna TaxID=35525 RepID=A0A164Z7N4_9CRUS|nr:Uncharacterized protein APZ42_018281 [Daphnia magna]
MWATRALNKRDDNTTYGRGWGLKERETRDDQLLSYKISPFFCCCCCCCCCCSSR